MAVYPEIPGLKVEVKIDGETATEFPADNIELEEGGDNRIPTVSKYIEAKTGAEFHIEANMTTEVRSQIELPAGEPRLFFTIWIDGIWRPRTSTSCLSLEGFRFCRKLRAVPEKHADGSLLQREFTFAEVLSVETSDLQKVAKDKVTAQNLGLIEVIVGTCVSGAVDTRGALLKQQFRRGGLSLAEKSIKGREISHGTAIKTTGRPAKPPHNRKAGNHEPLCRFNFYYRSKAALQKLSVIEQTPEPSELDSMTPEQLRELAAIGLRVRQNGGAKRETDDEDHGQRSATLIKTEHVDITEEAKWDFPQEPVDLTEDD